MERQIVAKAIDDGVDVRCSECCRGSLRHIDDYIRCENCERVWLDHESGEWQEV